MERLSAEHQGSSRSREALDKKSLADDAEDDGFAMSEAADRALAEGEAPPAIVSEDEFVIENAYRRGGAEIYAHSGYTHKARWIYKKSFNNAKAVLGARHQETIIARREWEKFEEVYDVALREMPLEDDVPPCDPKVEMNLRLGEKNLEDLVRTQGASGRNAAMARTDLVSAYVDADRTADASRLLDEVGWTLSVNGLKLPFPKTSPIKPKDIALPPEILHRPDVEEEEIDLFERVIADSDKPHLATPPEILTLGKALRRLLKKTPPDKQVFAGAVTRTLSRTDFCIHVLPEGLTARRMFVNAGGSLQLACTNGLLVDLTKRTDSVVNEPREFKLIPYRSAYAHGLTTKMVEDVEELVPSTQAASSMLASALTPAEPQPVEIASLAQRLSDLPNNPPPDKKKFAQEVGDILERNGYCIKVYPEGRIARRMYTNPSGSLGFQCTDGTNPGLARRTDDGHLEVRRIELIPYRRRYSRQPVQNTSP